MLVDTHAHLCDPTFEADLDEVIARAREAGVERAVAVGESLIDARKNLELADRYPNFVRPAAGLFPTHLDEREGARIEDLLRANPRRWAAVGEVGLDYWKVTAEEDRAIQRKIFGRFIELAVELDLPLNVHSRSAGHHALRFLIEHGAQRVQMHAFDGKASRAMVGVEAGFFFSVPPSVVRSIQKQKLVARVPLSNLLLETDSPVLGPDRHDRNEPCNLLRSLTAIAEIKGVSEGTVAAAIAENTLRLYREGLEAFPSAMA